MYNLSEITEEKREVLKDLILLLEENHSKILKMKTHQAFIKFLKDNIEEIHQIKKTEDRLINFNRKCLTIYTYYSYKKEGSVKAYGFSYKISEEEEYEFSEATLKELIEDAKAEYLRSEK